MTQRPTLLQRANQWLLENPIGHGDSIRQRNASLLVTELRDELAASLPRVPLSGLRERITPYLKHKRTCPAFMNDGSPSDRDCTCGLADLLACLAAPLEPWEQERAEIVAALDEIVGGAGCKKSLVQRIKDELLDYMDVLEEVSTVYDSITIGRFSKPNTAARYIIDEVEERIREDVDEALKEQAEAGEPVAAPPPQEPK